jgi:hypothetical protein
MADGAWSQVRLQLLDLANKLARSAEDGTRPPLALDRVWMRDNGRVVLLDFRRRMRRRALDVSAPCVPE